MQFWGFLQLLKKVIGESQKRSLPLTGEMRYFIDKGVTKLNMDNS